MLLIVSMKCTWLMLIIGCGDCMYRIMLSNSYMQFDDDNCGVCIYEGCLFFFCVMIIWWMMGDKHVHVLLFFEHVECWLLVVNSVTLRYPILKYYINNQSWIDKTGMSHYFSKFLNRNENYLINTNKLQRNIFQIINIIVQQ